MLKDDKFTSAPPGQANPATISFQVPQFAQRLPREIVVVQIST